LNSNLFKFKYFHLITELPLGLLLLLHGCWPALLPCRLAQPCRLLAAASKIQP
jgi:hypothetical protein